MKKFVTLLYCALLSSLLLAQGVGVNETGADPHPSAGLDIDFNNKGFLPPRMNDEERDAIQNPALGLMVFNTTSNCVEVFYGTFWQSMHCGCSVAPSDLTYSDNGPITYCLNQSIPLNSPATQGGNPSSYTVLPPLPAGLFLNTTTGQLSGSPAAETAASDYTFSASNACGSTTRIINFGVNVIPSALSIISGPSAPTANMTAMYSVQAVSGAPSYTWTVPDDWTIDSGQGSTVINVTVGANSGTITATASNACGSSSAPAKTVSAWRPVNATGGAITNYTADGTNGVNGVQYQVHSFASVGSSSFVVNDIGTEGQVDYLIVAGGGGGAHGYGGGGGAGGMQAGSTIVTQTTYPASVGGGGEGSNSPNNGQSGQNSSVFGVTSIGGGFGNYDNSAPLTGGSGGSGGGAGGTGNSNTLGGAGTVGQGNNGGNGLNQPAVGPSGGGGGASSAGQNATTSKGGDGGNGAPSSITGVSVVYAGGGGGGTISGTLGAGGTGGGGTPSTTQSIRDGLNGLGGGGAGGRFNQTPGGSGGSGIVIIRYPITNPNL